MYDIIIRGAQLIDGTDSPGKLSDLAVSGKKISAIGEIPLNAESKTTIDATGLTLCPGFIDVHNHSDGWLLKDPYWDVKVRQGFTTEVLMADGISYAPFSPETAPEWMHYLRSLNGLESSDYSGWHSIENYFSLLKGKLIQNVATHVPYANIRTMYCGFGKDAPTAEQSKKIAKQIEIGLEFGACGLSTGLEYLSENFAETQELINACKVFSGTRSLYVTHIRYPLGTLNGLKEAVEIAEKSNVPLHVSHLKGANPQEAEELLSYIDNVAVNQVDFSFDVYPYSAASTMLHYLLPYDIWVDGPSKVIEKLQVPEIQKAFSQTISELDLSNTHIAWVDSTVNKTYQGSSLADYISHKKQDAPTALCNLLTEENLSVLLVFRRSNDEIVHPFLQHPNFMLGSDGVHFPESMVHPRCYGSAARMLGPNVRDYRLFSLEKAIEKMSSIPAKRFGLTDRGEIKLGNVADLVVFDREAVRDLATYDTPQRLPEGIVHVLVSGTHTVQYGSVSKLTPLAGEFVKAEF